MEYPCRRGNYFADFGAIRPERADRVERLGLFFHGHPRAAAQGLLKAQSRIEHFRELRFPSRSWNWNRRRPAFVDSSRARCMGRARGLAQFARLAARVYGIDTGGRNIFPPRAR